MIPIFASDLNLSPFSIGVIAFSGLSFIVMFGIASAKGGFNELVQTTLENDAIQREKKINKKGK
tara:strand:- start:6887 stop:7078 length:192 start_codon:yes stop_codon:yes gene_type:complete